MLKALQLIERLQAAHFSLWPVYNNNGISRLK